MNKGYQYILAKIPPQDGTFFYLRHKDDTFGKDDKRANL
jgi:hypothetical protein